MSPDDVTKALIEVLQTVQKKSGLPCPPLDGSSVPPKVLEKFSSTIWPPTTIMVARKLGVSIPKDVHIFGGEKGKPLLTIDQTAALICAKAVQKTPMKTAA